MTCNDCGATVTRSDRFCPACGTPNAHCKFHPKFGPEAEVFEPAIVDGVAPDGQPACPRCRRAITPPDERCRSCGMELGRAWHARARRQAAAVQASHAGHRRVPYRSLDELGTAAHLLCSVVAVLGTLFGLGQLWRLARLEGVLTAGPLDGDLTRALDALGAMGVAAIVVTGLALAAWARRGLANLPALAVAEGDDARPPAWFVPGLNLYRPKQVLDDLWRSGDLDLPAFPADWRRAAAPAWSMVAWTSFLGAVVIGGTSRIVAGQVGAVTLVAGVEAPFDAVVAAAMAALAGLLLAVAAFLTQDLVTKVGERQDERCAALLDGDAGLAPAATAAPRAEPHDGRTALARPPAEHQVLWGRY